MASDGGGEQVCVRCGTHPSVIWRWCPDCGGSLAPRAPGSVRTARRSARTTRRLSPVDVAPVVPLRPVAG